LYYKYNWQEQHLDFALQDQVLLGKQKRDILFFYPGWDLSGMVSHMLLDLQREHQLLISHATRPALLQH